jgi:8-oxo-dGTP diphosphatase
MEIWDILDENGEKTGRTMVRGEPQKPGDYYLAVHIWIRNGQGEYLIQKRDDEKPLWPGVWAVTGGAAIVGESSLEAALRETEEELGIRADPGRMRLVDRMKRKGWFTDIWLLEQDFPLENIVMQPGEVTDVLWASKERIREMTERKEFVKYSYLDRILD